MILSRPGWGGAKQSMLPLGASDGKEKALLSVGFPASVGKPPLASFNPACIFGGTCQCICLADHLSEGGLHDVVSMYSRDHMCDVLG